MNILRTFSLWGAVLLVPTLAVWIIGFLGTGAHLSWASDILTKFHALPKARQVLVEVVLPAVALSFGIIAYRRKEPKNMSLAVGVLGALLLLVGLLGTFLAPTATDSAAAAQGGATVKDATYTINGSPVTLKDGTATTEAAPGSASTITTSYFGNDISGGDLNNDGVHDTAFVLTQTTGGSGTFYYVVVALKTPTGYIGTNGILLGDRIMPKMVGVKGTELVVTFLTRGATEPMSAKPTVSVTKYFEITDGKLIEVSK